MRFTLLIALILLTGGFLGSTAYQSGVELTHLSHAQLLAIGDSLTVIVALLLPAALMLVAMIARGATRMIN
jgi:hypothetical protein